ncbi:MAG: superoxide dismutase [Planctomycetota bacterium]|nr:superoxide dismutase [Planctomycetota bacterium]
MQDPTTAPESIAENTTDASIDRRTLLFTLGAAGALSAAGLAIAQPGGQPQAPRGLQPRNPIDNRPPSTDDPKPGEKTPSSPITPEFLGFDAVKGEYTLPPLPYDKKALEPFIDAQTMEIHHGKHHDAYVKGLNKALAELKKIRESSGDAALIKHWSRELSFHGSGHINHTLFWNMMAPPGNGPGQNANRGGGVPTGTLMDAINRDFGGFEAFAAQFKAAANAVEGAGWAWLVLEPFARRLMVIQGEKQQNLMLTGVHPLLGIDVWEHAYYLKYQNKRSEYVGAFMNVINWPFVQRLFDAATK